MVLKSTVISALVTGSPVLFTMERAYSLPISGASGWGSTSMADL